MKSCKQRIRYNTQTSKDIFLNIPFGIRVLFN